MSNDIETVEIDICLLAQIQDDLEAAVQLFEAVGDKNAAIWMRASLENLDDARRRHIGEAPAYEPSARMH